MKTDFDSDGHFDNYACCKNALEFAASLACTASIAFCTAACTISGYVQPPGKHREKME
jgi:hypothetical protein